MHTLSVCGTGPQILSLPFRRQFRKPRRAPQRAKALSPVLRRVNFPFTEAKIVPNLVPDGVRHDPLKIRRIPCHLFMRTLKNSNPVRTLRRYVRKTPLRFGPSFVQSQQIGRWPHRLHTDHQVPHPRSKTHRDRTDGAFHDRVKRFGCDP